MIHPKQALNIGQSKCSLGVPLAVNRNRACKAVQVECHTGGQEGGSTQSPRHSLSLCNLSPNLTPWSHLPHPDNFPGPVPMLVVSQSFILLQIPAWFPSLPLALTSSQVKFQTSPGSCENLLLQQPLKAGFTWLQTLKSKFYIKHAQGRWTLGGIMLLQSKYFPVDMCKSQFLGTTFGAVS